MNALELLGVVGASSLRDRLSKSTDSDGVARFMLDRLTGEQVAAIVTALLADGATAAKVRIALPRKLVDGFGLPETVITDERTVALRHAECDRPALLLANTDDDQGTSLQDVALIGAKELSEEPVLWVAAASRNLGLSDQHLAAWEAALRGFSAADNWTLHQISHYVEMTRTAVETNSLPLVDALGWALPALRLPRDSGYFRGMREKDLNSSLRWTKLFGKLVSDRRPLLEKQRPPRGVIESDDLRTQFEAVKQDIKPEVHPAIEAFINSPACWQPEAEALSLFEWETDGIQQIFSGLRQRKTNLPQETIEFFDFNHPDRLSDVEKEYLKKARETKTPKEASDLDREFYEAHREALGEERALRAKWERFVFGRPIECTEFLDGLLRTVERLYGQATSLGQSRTLEIETTRRRRSQWLELNERVAMAFSLRYRGLPALMGDAVTWKDHELFSYEAILEKARRRKKYQPNKSVARANLQIKFDVTLVIDGQKSPTVQMIWTGRPEAIGSEMFGDLERLAKRPFARATITRQPVSSKGLLQSISLSDVATMQPAFGRDSGSLISKIGAFEDLGKKFTKALKSAVPDRVSAEGSRIIRVAWDQFSESYVKAIDGWLAAGLSDAKRLEQAEKYGSLLEALAKHATGDINRQDLVQPVLSIGCIAIEGGAPSAIIAPWHPMRLAASVIKARAASGLIQHILTAPEVNFGDPRLFFADLRAELSHPYYPEIAVGYAGSEPVLLAEAGTVNEYSLMERPVRDPSQASTDVDPVEAALQVRKLMDRYLDLQPHERSNLSIMLYNCDAAGLPFATINAMATVHDQDEMHCNVLVRHRDRAKLSRVYSELLERSENDLDALVASETSSNFMSKLRIGVLLDGGSKSSEGDVRSVDVAFLHDVVSRQAKEGWFPVLATAENPSIYDNVPPRWSYRRVTAEDQLKATTYLVCPRQPKIGWAYIDAVSDVIRRQSHGADEHILPVRQISFQDHGLKTMFDEVHEEATWVATYDDLLDKRQLLAQGINVIRYRRQRTHGRNMVVSSTADLRVLNVLVRRRLNELSLGLTDERLGNLAQRMIDDACAISGDIVLRAAKQGVSAGELIGLVLSRALVAEEFGPRTSVAWFLLDDYAEWLGQREQGIADILALSVGMDANGAPTLRAVVTEAKYVALSSSADAQRTSRRQLTDTVQRIEDALFGDPGRLDRDLWLSRIADLLLDGTTALGQSTMLEAVRDGIRQGTTAIELRGYSHVFISGPADAGASGAEQAPVGEMKDGLQEVFSRDQLRNLVLAYEARQALAPIREALGSERPWATQTFRLPAPRVNWVNKSDAPDASLAPAPAIAGVGVAAPAPAEDAALDVGRAAPDEAPAVEPFDAPLLVDDENTVDEGAMNGLDLLIARHALQQSATSEADVAWLEATALKLRSALLGYSLQAKIVGTRLTPNAALVRFMGSDTLRVEDLQKREAVLLTTHGLRLVGITPLPGEIVVAVERPKRQIVSLWDVWKQRQINRNEAGLNTAFVLGLRELDGEVLYLNLGSAFDGARQHEPHTLVAGTTGSGKSVLIVSLILDIAATNPSDLAQIVLIDPKMGVDYSALERLPHIQGGIIVDQETATAQLERLVEEMDRRYELFRKRGVRDLRSYNVAAAPGDRLPTIFLVHDEFAEWMMTEEYKETVTANVSRLGVKARAAGIHLIFAAQRPDVNVMPMQLRDNLGNRLILKVSSAGTSEIALGVKGAESLLGNGHLAAKLGGESGIIFAQAPYLSDPDIMRAVDAIIRDNRLAIDGEGASGEEAAE